MTDLYKIKELNNFLDKNAIIIESLRTFVVARFRETKFQSSSIQFVFPRVLFRKAHKKWNLGSRRGRKSQRRKTKFTESIPDYIHSQSSQWLLQIRAWLNWLWLQLVEDPARNGFEQCRANVKLGTVLILQTPHVASTWDLHLAFNPLVQRVQKIEIRKLALTVFYWFNL